MASRLNPYLTLPGTARQAAEFYQGVFGGEMSVMTFGDAGAADAPHADQVMHAQLDSPSGYTIMLSDMPPGTDHSPGNDMAISLSGDDADELRGYWDRLCEGGSVQVPLEPQMWGDVFGMCSDRFGVAWMVNIAGDAA
jgi:PhnB protein